MSSNSNWNLIAATFQASPADMEKLRTRPAQIRRWLRIGKIVGTIAVLVCFGLSVSELISAWRSAVPDDWKTFFDSLWLAPQFGLPIFIGLGQVENVFQIQAKVVDALEAARERNNTLAPPASEQPALVDTAVEAQEPARSNTLRAAWSTARSRALVLAVFAWVFALLFASFAVVLLIAPVADAATPSTLGAVFGLLAIVCAFVAAWQARKMLVLGRIRDLKADEWSVRWRVGSQRYEILWHEAMAFVTLHQRLAPHLEVLRLESPSAVLSWQIVPRSSEAERAAHRALCWQIVTRTKLPLRDVSAALDEPSPTEVAQRASTAPHAAVAPDASMAEINGKPRSSRRGCLAGFVTGCLPWLLIFLAPLTLAGVGLGEQRSQQQHYANLPVRLHEELPLYQDQLAYPNGDWPNEQASADNSNETFAYENGAYHISGVDGSSILYALGTPSYGDAAVEVTASERQQNDDDGIGVILDVTPSETSFVAFFVDSGGYWWLYCYNLVPGNDDASWTIIAYDSSAAITVGPTATNDVLVIHRGGQFRCYVNGAFLGTYSDDAAPKIGRMGVYLDSGDTEGIFSNFSVYPALS